MNIFLEAFVDTNFGDNVFVHIIASRYPQHTFYMLVKEGYETSYQILAKAETNLELIPPTEENTFLSDMDAMIIVGGDLFWNGNYRNWLDKIEVIKQKGGPVIFLGMSLFNEYTSRTRFSLRVLFSQADVMVLRESQSGAQAKQIAPKANILAATDMAFTTDVTEYSKKEPEAGVLGISIRKKIPRNAPDAYTQYCEGIAKTAVQYLQQDPKNRVHFLALSKGVYDDEAVAAEIMSLCSIEDQQRMQCITFHGDVAGYIDQMQNCEKIICTRFHALVFALLLRKPFVPIAYEDKVHRLLDEIGYTGPRLGYEEPLNPQELLRGLEQQNYCPEKLHQYLDQASKFFVETDKYLNTTGGKNSCIWSRNQRLLTKFHKVLHKIWKVLKK